MKKQMLGLGGVLCAGVLLAQSAWAQPDPNDAPKAENPPENNRPRFNRGNVEEMRKNMETGMRRMLGQVGITEPATQDAVLAFVKSDLEARRPLREQGMKLFQALRNGGVTDDQMLALVTDYRAAQEAEKARRELAMTELDAKIHFTQNPRLEAVLLLAGVVGESSGAMFLPMGGMGGFGGGGGRNGGGPRAQGGDRPNNQQLFGGGPNAQAGQPGLDGQMGNNDARREEMRKRMLERFDKNADGTLDDAERATMREERERRRDERRDRDGQPAPQDNNAPAPEAAPAPAPAEMAGA